MKSRLVTATLVLGLVVAGGLSGLCAMVCAAAGIEHQAMMQDHHAASQVAADHHGAAAVDHGSHAAVDHTSHTAVDRGTQAAATTAMDRRQGEDARHPDRTRPHCPACAGDGCGMTDRPMPADASLTAGELPSSAPTLGVQHVEPLLELPGVSPPSRVSLPECQPPRA